MAAGRVGGKIRTKMPRDETMQREIHFRRLIGRPMVSQLARQSSPKVAPKGISNNNAGVPLVPAERCRPRSRGRPHSE
jgi:hypothetical protein